VPSGRRRADLAPRPGGPLLPNWLSANDLCRAPTQQHRGVRPPLLASCWLTGGYVLPYCSHVDPIHMRAVRQHVASSAVATRQMTGVAVGWRGRGSKKIATNPARPGVGRGNALLDLRNPPLSLKPARTGRHPSGAPETSTNLQHWTALATNIPVGFFTLTDRSGRDVPGRLPSKWFKAKWLPNSRRDVAVRNPMWPKRKDAKTGKTGYH
jgi:hypothetical protein